MCVCVCKEGAGGGGWRDRQRQTETEKKSKENVCIYRNQLFFHHHKQPVFVVVNKHIRNFLTPATASI